MIVYSLCSGNEMVDDGVLNMEAVMIANSYFEFH